MLDACTNFKTQASLTDSGETTADQLSGLSFMGGVEYAVDVEKGGIFPFDDEYAELRPSIQKHPKTRKR